MPQFRILKDLTEIPTIANPGGYTRITLPKDAIVEGPGDINQGGFGPGYIVTYNGDNVTYTLIKLYQDGKGEQWEFEGGEGGGRRKKSKKSRKSRHRKSRSRKSKH
jgi:hypothetical protein